jgi:hypothetical protein
MTKRATFTQAELERAIRAADKAGKVAVMTPAGIVFAESDKVALPSPEQPPQDPFDAWKAKREARREGRP